MDRLASGLLAVGLKPGDRLGIWGPNSHEWYITQWAAAKAGLILVNINPAYQPAELEYCLNKVGIRGLVSSQRFKTQDYVGMIGKVAPELKGSKAGELRSETVKSLEKVILMDEGLYNHADYVSMTFILFYFSRWSYSTHSTRRTSNSLFAISTP